MSLNTHCSPRIYIKDKEIGFDTFSISFPGNNQINSCTIKINHSISDWSRLFNEEIKIYLNETDGVPTFRGFIKQVVPSDSSLSITAYDPRYLLSGNDGIPINITDKDNYDGYTISQFLIEYIDKYINTDKTYLATDYITDTTISTTMKDVRGFHSDIYSMLSGAFTKGVDDTDVDNLVGYNINVIDDGVKAQLIIEKERTLTSDISLVLSERDGISSLTYNRRMPPSYGIHFTEDGKSGVYQHGNMPYGRINETGTGTFKTSAEASYASMISILKQQDDKQEIAAIITRGFEVGIGSIVRLNVDDFDVRGNHRVTTKNIAFSKNTMNCTIGLNKKPVSMKKYI
jgi:hypothetical protein